ncbi:alpha/beta-hydrolase [Daedalea quercina L-15889]|uniref:Alpha/beta-hydrolase n=1 Tax=Daedalea quercina L-15889 TaxID=1314783 RepID=A0A165NXL1_9APHY|nr:alpha/beta-hydrolase [Daedalea quercina L-15889]
MAPYGTWASPITADVILQSVSNKSELFVDPITSAIYWIEGRPAEGGRDVIVGASKGQDVFGKGWNARTGVQEYGGGAAMAYGGAVYFSNYADNRVYKIAAEGEDPKPITPDNKNYRYAKVNVHPKHNHLLVAVLEDHTRPLPQDVVTTLCIINSKTQSVTTIVSGADFYAFPSFSADGTYIAWEQWSHPDMPWEGSEIFVANVDVNDNSVKLSDITYVAGKKIDISASTPVWASNDVLVFTTDETGYHNPWTYSVSSGKAAPVLPVSIDEDFNQPLHRLGTEYSAPLDQRAGRVIYATLKNDHIALRIVKLATGAIEDIPSAYTDIQDLKRVADNSFAFLANSAEAPQTLVVCVLADNAQVQFHEVNVASTEGDAPKIPNSLISVAQAITLKTEDGEPLHVLYLPPKNPAYEALDGERPPCVVDAHGGPTGHTSASLDWSKQYFTSRGWAWLDVNYGGSSGYGRKYIKRLEGKWGIIDVEDCTSAMEQLSSAPYSLIDPKRSVIRGGSAGGFTTLATICFKPDAFAAATSLFGIADLRSLAKETHKFESHYLEKLVGGTLEEVPEVYKKRSPIFHADKIKTPLLVLQGSIDRVVPPDQAEVIVKAIKERNGRVEYTVFEGEGHGWRKAETIKAAIEQELHFYEAVFGIKGKSSTGGRDYSLQ